LAEAPRVVLVGDSICIGYGPLVAAQLAGRANVVIPVRNHGDSSSVLRRLDAWAIHPRPDLVHLNCGLHDLRRSRADGTYQVDLERYGANLREIARRVDALLVFATTTPVVDERHAGRNLEFDRFEADVRRYNQVMEQVMREAAVAVDDLHAVVTAGGPERLLGDDGVHFTPAGNELLAETVAGAIELHLR
jgi:lysophospholipase L1-like esterase